MKRPEVRFKVSMALSGRKSSMSSEGRARVSEASRKRMLNCNPMKDPIIAERVASVNRERGGGPGRWVGCEVCGKEKYLNQRQIKASVSGKFFCSQEHFIFWRYKTESGEAFSKPRLGKKHTTEAKLKMSEAAIARIQRDSSKFNTKPELVVKRELDRIGVTYVQQFRLSGQRFVFDFAIPSKRILIEVDGCYWHGCQRCGFAGRRENLRNDALKSDLADSVGWRLIRLKECCVI